jgi:cell division protein ZapE
MGPLRAYEALIVACKLHPDALQRRAVQSLQRLFTDLGTLPPSSTGANAPPQGVFLHGGVGRGKTLLMDLFHRSLPPGLGLRVHSHAFFLNLHARIHAQRVGGAGGVASATAHALGGARVLCLDELEVSDIADAVLLRRVFSGLCASRVALVSTSNCAPHQLYAGGLNRELLFLPCERELVGRCEVVRLDEGLSGEGGGRDYRAPLGSGAAASPLLLPTPAAGEAACAALAQPVGGSPPPPRPASVHAAFERTLQVPLACGSAYARFTFAGLCGAARLGAADYLALAKAYRAVVVTDVPAAQRSRDATRRLVTLVDILYEEGTLLVLVLAQEEGEAPLGLEALLAAEEEEEGLEAREAAFLRGAVVRGALAAGPAARGAGEALGLAPVPGTGAAAVSAAGGASGRSALMVGQGGGREAVEWSATGRTGASLANLGSGAGSFLRAAKRRCSSRLRQMMGWEWAEQWASRHSVPLEPLRAALARCKAFTV